MFAMIRKYLERRLKQGTVILCFKILLDNVIKNGKESSMTKSEINKAFDECHKSFGIGTFRSDYLLRQTSRGELNAIGVKPDNATFYIRKEFIKDLSVEQLKDISMEIAEHYYEITEKQRELFSEIDKAYNLDIEGRKEFILELLLNRETDKKGQSFEVTAYAILKVYYHVRGFELNRFSTVYSNDGGVDFASQIAVYQVTTSLSNKKFDEDLDKAPLKKRVFVYKKKVSGFDESKFDNELVLDHISSTDLQNHLNYLIEKKPSTNSLSILNVVKSEFEREYYF